MYMCKYSMLKWTWTAFVAFIALLFLRTSISQAVAESSDAWYLYRNPAYGFSVEYPSDWIVAKTLSNYGKKRNVIENRILFYRSVDEGINIDIFPNPDNQDALSWYREYQQQFLPADADVQENLVVGGVDAVYTYDPGDSGLFARHTTILTYGGYSYRIEYQIVNGNNQLDVYRHLLTSFKFDDIDNSRLLLFVDFWSLPQPNIPNTPEDQSCCGYTDPYYNPYTCYDGNCVWWARYKRPDTGGQTYPYWGNASNWPSRAIEEGFTVNGTPATDALGCWVSMNHVAYVENYQNGTASFSDMDYGEFNCVIDYWNQTNFTGVQFIHPKSDNCCGCEAFTTKATSLLGSCPLPGNIDGPLASPNDELLQVPERDLVEVSLSSDAEMTDDTGSSNLASAPGEKFIENSSGWKMKSVVQEEQEITVTDYRLEQTWNIPTNIIPPYSNNYVLAKSVIGIAGSKKSSANYTAISTAGQFHETGELHGQNYKVLSGFWPSANPDSFFWYVYLPIVIK